jgi:hypothetical protein
MYTWGLEWFKKYKIERGRPAQKQHEVDRKLLKVIVGTTEKKKIIYG